MGLFSKKDTGTQASSGKSSKKASPKFNKNDGWHSTVEQFDAFREWLYSDSAEPKNK
ncbi:hypothetical protein [Nonomuraea helvata]|uniref:Uncharacterized protein n=1 Tax=Nonomuraea helvata TaxID=37484 RepID=A0ABV5RZR8_9ACTN